jgi:hypothetical protein
MQPVHDILSESEWVLLIKSPVVCSLLVGTYLSAYQTLTARTNRYILPCWRALLFVVAAYAGYTIVSGNFPGSQAQYDVLLAKQLSGISEKDRAAAAAVAVPIADEILRDK